MWLQKKFWPKTINTSPVDTLWVPKFCCESPSSSSPQRCTAEQHAAKQWVVLENLFHSPHPPGSAPPPRVQTHLRFQAGKLPLGPLRTEFQTSPDFQKNCFRTEGIRRGSTAPARPRFSPEKDEAAGYGVSLGLNALSEGTVSRALIGGKRQEQIDPSSPSRA